MAIEHRAGLIHASSFQNNGLAGLRAARRLGVPFVYEMRGLKQLLESARQPRFAESPRNRYLELAPKYWARTRARLNSAELALEVGPLTIPPPLDLSPSADAL